jgi:hypothetical protein
METEAAAEMAAAVTMRTVENGESGGNGKEVRKASDSKNGQ